MLIFSHDFLRVIAHRNKVARGLYQRKFLDGVQRASGSDLNSRWGARYHDSRQSVLKRIEQLDMAIVERRLCGRLFIVVGSTERDAENVDDETLEYAWR